MNRLSLPSALLLIAVLITPLVRAQEVRVLRDDEWCDRSSYGDDREQYCEVHEITLPANRTVIAVDAGTNGGVSVKGWDRNEILVRAKLTGSARSQSAARALVEETRVVTSGRTIYADIPETRSREWAYVSFELYVPHTSNLDLETHNGGVSIESVNGDITFDVLNGGVSLADLGGDVQGHTTNGGLEIELTGDTWDGRMMDVETTNGGVKIYVPDDYDAELVTGTVNGRVRVDFPVMVQGDVNRRLSTTLGNGGPTIRVITTNGGVVIRRS